MAGVVLNGSTSGSVTLDPPAVAGSTVITLPSTSGTMAKLTDIPAAQWTTTGSDIYYSTGNVGIGTTAPAYALDVKSGTAQFAFSNTGTNPRLGFAYNNSAENGEIHSSSLKFFTGNSGTFSGTEKMRINASGSLMVNYTGTVTEKFWLTGGATNTAMVLQIGTNGYAGVEFHNASNGTAGSIVVNSGSVAYNTSSDYRLKENIAPMTGALSKVALLKPVTYSWKEDGSSGEGFIAHELAEVIPKAVTGEKDAVKDNGSIKPQGIDTSYLIATLTAAIQEQQALIENLTTRLSALENK